MEEIKLGAEQKSALFKLKTFIQFGEEPAFLVFGPAGTGKSLLINELVNWCDDTCKNYCLCAPTHKASLVMERYTGREAITLHKLLSLSPNLDIFELDFNNLMFKVGSSKLNIPYNGIVICDEASMINDDLYKLLLNKCAENHAKIAFFGDFRQLSPVKQESLSCIIHTNPQAELTKIYRQSEENGLIPTLTSLRTHSLDRFEESIGLDGKLLITSNINEFLAKAIIQTKKAISNGDVLETKVTAFTNDRVNSYNNIIHKHIAGDKEYVKHEFLTGCENLEFNNFKFYNSMDYIIISEPEKTDIFIPTFGKMPGWKFELYDSLDKKSENISILSREISADYLEALACRIEEYRIAAIDSKRFSRYKSSQYWKKYFEIINSFTSPVNMYYDNRLIRKKSFEYGYATTVHKLQGSSYNNILIDMRNIEICKDEEARRQLQYVALSRTRKNALIFQ